MVILLEALVAVSAVMSQPDSGEPHYSLLPASELLGFLTSDVAGYQHEIARRSNSDAEWRQFMNELDEYYMNYPIATEAPVRIGPTIASLKEIVPFSKFHSFVQRHVIDNPDMHAKFAFLTMIGSTPLAARESELDDELLADAILAVYLDFQEPTVRDVWSYAFHMLNNGAVGQLMAAGGAGVDALMTLDASLEFKYGVLSRSGVPAAWDELGRRYAAAEYEESTDYVALLGGMARNLGYFPEYQDRVVMELSTLLIRVDAGRLNRILHDVRQCPDERVKFVGIYARYRTHGIEVVTDGIGYEGLLELERGTMVLRSERARLDDVDATSLVEMRYRESLEMAIDGLETLKREWVE